MNSFNSLLFPDTDFCKERLYPLLLFFSPIHFLQAVEPDPESDERTECDIFMEQGLCQGHTPMPLEKNRQRFLRLIKDIRERKDDYGAQLASLTMAAMSSPSSAKGGEAKYEIISSLLSSHSLPQSSPEQEELWQARLVLAIAEILEKDEDELQQHLQILDSQEIEMFRSLQGDDSADDDDPFAELQRIREQIETRRPQDEKNRFNAWLRLMDHHPLPKDLFWLASSQDSADQIINRFEKKTGEIAIPVLKLLLPAYIRVSPIHLLKQINDFHQETAQIGASIKEELCNLAQLEHYDPGSADTLLPGSTDWSEAWRLILDDHFPASSHGRSEVTIYILADSPIAELLSLKESSTTVLKHGLLGVLKRSQEAK